MNKTKTTIWLTPEVKEKLKILCAKSDMSISGWIELQIQETELVTR